MRLLTCAFYYYYGRTRGIEPQFYYLVRAPEALGYSVDFFDCQVAARVGVEQLRRLFLSIVRGGRYDAVFIATHEDEFDCETLAEAQQYCPVIAWNSDDEWRWEGYSRERAGWYTSMVTNSPAVYQANRHAYPNLLHAQWACTGFWDGRATAKDIDFSFVGQVYGARAGQIRWLTRHAGLQAFGKGSGNIAASLRQINSRRYQLQTALLRVLAGALLPELIDELSTIDFAQVNQLWNRSRISFTPLDSSQGQVRQIKSRVFDMGLSGTLMLAQRTPALDQYYEPGVEYIPFETLEECAELARFYLRNEAARAKIAAAYAQRTVAEHLWRHRIEHVLNEAGVPAARVGRAR